MSIKIENLSYIYMKDTPFEKKALDDVNITIKDGEFIAVIGHTGSGKSTLVQHMNGLLKPSSGKIYIDGKDITNKDVKMSSIRRNIGLVFQYPEHQLFEETIEKDISFGPKNSGFNNDEVLKKTKMAMDIVGLDYEEYKDKSPFDLSGGQKRRVAIAGVLAMQPNVLILDEPTAGLDPMGRDDLLNKIKRFHEQYGMTIILVSHSMEDVANVAERILVMHEGQCVLDGSPSKIFKEIDTLENVGLAVPQMTYLTRELKKRGFNIENDVYTIDQAKKEIIKLLRGVEDD